jgi:hypothetical protein
MSARATPTSLGWGEMSWSDLTPGGSPRAPRRCLHRADELGMELRPPATRHGDEADAERSWARCSARYARTSCSRARVPASPTLAAPTTTSPGSSPTTGQAGGAACLLPGHGRHGLPAAVDGHHRVRVVPHHELRHGWSPPPPAPSASSVRAKNGMET